MGTAPRRFSAPSPKDYPTQVIPVAPHTPMVTSLLGEEITGCEEDQMVIINTAEVRRRFGRASY